MVMRNMALICKKITGWVKLGPYGVTASSPCSFSKQTFGQTCQSLKFVEKKHEKESGQTFQQGTKIICRKNALTFSLI